MRRTAIVLSILAALVLLLVLVGQGYGQGNGTGNGTGGGSSSGCCALASAYASTDDENLDVIRQFRDEYLASNAVGRGVAVMYYDVVSPPLATFIDNHPSIKPLARAALSPVVFVSTVAVDTTTAEKAVIGSLMVLVAMGAIVWMWKRHGRGARSI